MTKIAVIYYSLYGHCRGLAEMACKATEADGITAALFQVYVLYHSIFPRYVDPSPQSSPETLSSEALANLHAGPRNSDPLVTGDVLEEHDGYIFVIPTRYGRAVAQFSAFFDMTGGLWAKQVSGHAYSMVEWC